VWVILKAIDDGEMFQARNEDLQGGESIVGADLGVVDTFEAHIVLVRSGTWSFGSSCTQAKNGFSFHRKGELQVSGIVPVEVIHQTPRKETNFW